MGNTVESLLPNGNGQAYLELSGRVTSMEKATLETHQLLKELVHSNKNFTAAVSVSTDESRLMRARFEETMESLSQIIANTIEVKNGIVPAEFMRIKSYEDITAANSATINTLFKQQQEGTDRLHTRTLWAMGSVNGLLVLVIAALVLGKDAAVSLLPKLMGLIN